MDKKTSTGKKYTEAIGRRKTATARVRISPAAKTSILVNDKDVNDYFPTVVMQKTVTSPFVTTDQKGHFSVSVHVNGGGISGQAAAVRHGISRALVIENEEDKTALKAAGFLKRDARAKERRKFGLKKARKAPQWSKR